MFVYLGPGGPLLGIRFRDLFREGPGQDRSRDLAPMPRGLDHGYIPQTALALEGFLLSLYSIGFMREVFPPVVAHLPRLA